MPRVTLSWDRRHLHDQHLLHSRIARDTRRHNQRHRFARDSGVSVALSGSGTIGYYQVSSKGAVAHFGDAGFFGDLSGTALNKPIVGIAQTGDNGGYWLAASDGGIFNYGDAGFFGSAGGIMLNKPIVGIAPTADGGGYWLVATDGGIFNYGDAPFYGSTGSLHLNQPIVGMAATADGGGHWLVASDGGIFSYGDAQFYGSTGSLHLNKPIVGMAATPDGGGYWLVASDGGSSPTAMRSSTARPGTSTWPNPLWAWQPCPMGVATGSLRLTAASSTTGPRPSTVPLPVPASGRSWAWRAMGLRHCRRSSASPGNGCTAARRSRCCVRSRPAPATTPGPEPARRPPSGGSPLNQSSTSTR